MAEERQKAGWTEIPIGGLVLEAGSTDRYATGGWRTFRPILDRSRCIDCLICWWFCPDTAILVQGGKLLGFDLVHCKGCGICAAVCPPKYHAISMLEEVEARRRYGPWLESDRTGSLLERLRAEHAEIRGVLDEFLRQLRAAPAPLEAVAALGQNLLARLERHWAVEEAYLFPLLEENLGRVGGPLGLGWEHKAHRELLERLTTAATLGDGGTVQQLAGEIARAFEAHAVREEEVLFAAAERMVPAEVLEDAARAAGGEGI